MNVEFFKLMCFKLMNNILNFKRLKEPKREVFFSLEEDHKKQYKFGYFIVHNYCSLRKECIENVTIDTDLINLKSEYK